MIRRTLALIIVVAVIVYAGAKAMQLRTFFANNHAEYLINRGDYDAALAELSALDKAKRGSARTGALAARASLGAGRYEVTTGGLTANGGSPTQKFYAAVAAYESGQNAYAARLFRETTTASGNGLPDNLRTLATFAADYLTSGAGAGLPDPEPPRDKIALMLWHSMSGCAELSAGRARTAAVHFDSATALGAKSPQVRDLHAVAWALAGDFARAQRPVDYTDERPTSETYARLSEMIKALFPGKASLAITRDSAETNLEFQQAADLARYWCGARAALDSQASESINAQFGFLRGFLDQHPENVRAGLLLGDLLEQSGDLRGAYQQFEQSYQRHPTYSALLHLKSLSGDSPEWSGREGEYRDSPSVVAKIEAAELVTSQTSLRNDHLAFLTRSSASTEFNVPVRADYEITLISRGDRAFGISPVALVQIDGENSPRLYITSDSWDCYSIHQTLGKGRHQISIDYRNNSDRLLSQAEDRNLYVKSVIISMAGQE